MYKHHFTPYGYSFFKGEDKVLSYKCKFCNTIISSNNDISNLNHKDALCKSNSSKSTIIELIANKYDCSEHNETLSFKYNIFKKKIYKKFLLLRKKITIKVCELWLFIMSLKIK